MPLTKWQPLTPRHDVDDDGRVGWLELFFDLVYVAALIQFGDRLAADVSWGGVARFVGTFIVLWWTWTGTTAFMNRFAVDDVVHRLLTFVQMFAVGYFAVLVTAPIDDRTRWMALAYVAARVPLLLMYLRVRNRVPEAKPGVDLILRLFGLSAVIWLVSAAVPSGARYWLWAVALAVEFLAPLLSARRPAGPGAHEEHFRERYALFTIIVLGETFVKTLTELADIGISLRTQVYGSLGFLILVSLWWTYFDDVAESTIRRRPVVPLAGVGNRLVWVYTHLPLAAGLTAFGVASKKVIGVDSFAGDLKTSYAWLLAGSLVVVLLAVTVLDLVTASPHYAVDAPERVGPRVAAAGAIAVTGLLLATGTLGALAGIAIISVVVMAQIGAEVAVAAKRERRLEARLSSELAEARGGCEHLVAGTPLPLEAGERGEVACDLCLAADKTWVQLRVCLTCGHIGCCDDTPGRHATAHHEQTGHPTMATIEPGDSWAWCYVHRVMAPGWQAAER